MLIDCDTCAVRDVHCGDCVISVFLTLPRATDNREHVDHREHGDQVELDDAEQDAIGSLMAAGLVPPLRLVALSAPPDPERGIA